MKRLILRAIVVAMALSSLGTTGCALTSKAEALSVRWFDPEPLRASTTSSPASPSTPSTPSTKDASAKPRQMLEIGRVTSGIHLRDKIAYRDSAFEVGYYEENRWTERPEVYVRRAIARTLFEEHGVQRALAGQGPVLDVEVLAFEEVRGKPRVARVQLRMTLHDGARALAEKTITVERPATQDGIPAFVQAMAEALDAAAQDVARESVARESEVAR